MPIKRHTDLRPILRFPNRAAYEDYVAVEEPLEIRTNGEPLAVTMRTPGHDEELAAGFCWTEGVIDAPDDLERVEPCTLAKFGNVVDVILSDQAKAARADALGRARREFYLSSSCGLCGTQSLDRLERSIKPLQSPFVVRPQVLASLPRRMAEAQAAFAATGGLHAAALFHPAGSLRMLREDVGRHNAVDKVVGALLLSGQLREQPSILLVSGRVSFELVQKAARAFIPFMAAIGAPSSLAIDAAARFNITLVGFLKEDGRFNVYTGEQRIGL